MPKVKLDKIQHKRSLQVEKATLFSKMFYLWMESGHSYLFYCVIILPHTQLGYRIFLPKITAKSSDLKRCRNYHNLRMLNAHSQKTQKHLTSLL